MDEILRESIIERRRRRESENQKTTLYVVIGLISLVLVLILISKDVAYFRNLLIIAFVGLGVYLWWRANSQKQKVYDTFQVYKEAREKALLRGILAIEDLPLNMRGVRALDITLSHFMFFIKSKYFYFTYDAKNKVLGDWDDAISIKEAYRNFIKKPIYLKILEREGIEDSREKRMEERLNGNQKQEQL